MPDINDILRLIDREIWLVSAAHENQRGGLIATFVSQASIVPELPRMLVGIAKQHHTWGLIEASRTFTLHLLDESHFDWVWRFGLYSGHAGDKFAGLPELHAVAWLVCRVETSLDTGDRTLYLAEVLDGNVGKPTPPLTMRRLLQLAPPERLRELRAGLERDAVVDAAAIRAWRAISERSSADRRSN
jgi:flavin reductase (DIM6/NTAB) family NADH-FMN oxidoreductase RutF